MDITEATQQFLRTLAERDVPFMIVGGLALDTLGVVRGTVDVDVQVGLPGPPPHAEPDFLGAIIEERSRDVVFDQDVVICHLPGSPVPFELFFTTHWLPRQALERRRRVASPRLGLTVPAPTPEDFVLLKSAYMTHSSRRRAKAAQDAVDVESVLENHAGRLDMEYIEANARRLGTWDSLRALSA